jgi:hypothetical protein
MHRESALTPVGNSEVTDVCLYSPALWPQDDKNAILRSLDTRQAEAVKRELPKFQNNSLTDFHIAGSSPRYFANDKDGGVPKAISRIIMDGAIFFRKVHEAEK